jgi:hypothetical protein
MYFYREAFWYRVQVVSGAGGSMDRETVERFVIRILALAERSEDIFVRAELMRIADDLVAESHREPTENALQKQSRSH